jgi:hypothetical protein
MRLRSVAGLRTVHFDFDGNSLIPEKTAARQRQYYVAQIEMPATL